MSYVFRRGASWCIGYIDRDGKSHRVRVLARTKVEAKAIAFEVERSEQRIRLGLLEKGSK